MNPILLLIGGAALAAIAVATSAKSETKTPTKKMPSAVTGIDLGQYLANVFNSMGTGPTPDQQQRIKNAVTALGADENGNLTLRPSPQAIANLTTLAAQLSAEGVSPELPLALTGLAGLASQLPTGASTMSGPWTHLGSLTAANRQRQTELGTYTDISGFGDWWESFISKWANTWNRGPYRR